MIVVTFKYSAFCTYFVFIFVYILQVHEPQLNVGLVVKNTV